jgi:hypothetical protein
VAGKWWRLGAMNGGRVFRFEIRAEGSPRRKRYFAVDEDRDVSLELLDSVPGSLGEERAALLSWEGRRIPLNFRAESVTYADPVTGENYGRLVFTAFGRSTVAEAAREVGAYEFADEGEYVAAMTLAVEAILVTRYARSTPPYRLSVRFGVTPQDRLWTIADFGYDETHPVERIGE